MKAVLPKPVRKVRAAREEKGVTYEQISELTGIPYTEICRTLSAAKPKPEKLAAIRDAIRRAPEPEEKEAA